MLVARAWLLLKVVLAKLCPAPDEIKLSATLTLISSDVEVEAEAEVSADALAKALSCSKEAALLALSSLAGALFSDTFVAGSALTDLLVKLELLVKTELLADTDWLTEAELLAETDWLIDWLID
ncbi:hypothetical protein [Streptococcus cristatus]|uniref:hypothetical protein n=1 Tax=Streptococcus cristatus TaxID=45634 RepID=UPI0011AE5598|nr:hypothetical protein [Streptococcus cristatus]